MSSCAASAARPENNPLPEIHINGTRLDETLYAQELQYHSARDFASVRNKAGQALVIRQLLINELEKERSAGEPIGDEEEAIQALLEKNISCQGPSEVDCRRYFENNPERFMSQPLLQVEHILLLASKDDLSERDKTKQQAILLIEQLKADPTLFAALAEQFSVCPSKKTGGSLGQIGKGQTVPEFEKQIMRLPVGLAETPIQSRYGFHVVRMNKRINGIPLEYGMVKERIKQYLTQKAFHLAVQAYIQSLVEKANIEGIRISFTAENIFV